MGVQGCQGKRQSQGRSLEAMEAKITANFRFGKLHRKETTAVDDRQKCLVYFAKKHGRARLVLKYFKYFLSALLTRYSR